MDEKNITINTESNNQNIINNTNIGKIVKVFTNELTFGKKDRLVNIFGLFKHKNNNTNYVIYADVINDYNIIYYATAHIKENNILTLNAKKEEDTNIVKEYIFKLINKELLNDYEHINLNNIDTIEIIGFSKIEVKPEILSLLINLTIPKKTEAKLEEIKEKQPSSKKKKTPIKIILLLIVIACIGISGYIYSKNLLDTNTISKNIVCKIKYNHNELEAIVYEEKTFNFNNQDTLKSIDSLNSYVFNTKDEYLDFINKGLYYRYMPDNNVDGGYSLDNDTNTYKITVKEKIDETYTDVTSYEEVLSIYKNKGYSCTESINE